MYRRWALALLLLAVVAPACEDATGRCEGPGCCRSSIDCEGWETCDAAGSCGPALQCTTSAGCLGGDVCSPNGWCEPEFRFDPGGAVLWGYVGYAGWFWGAAPLEAPTRVRAGLYPDAVIVHKTMLDGVGNVIYLGSTVEYGDPSGSPKVIHRVHRFVPDPWLYESETWRPVPGAFLNDLVLDTPACMPTSAVARPGRDDVLYGCLDGNVYDSTGTLVATGAVPLGATAKGAVLLLVGTSLEYMHPDGTRTSVVFLYDTRDILTVRSSGEAFWIITWDPFEQQAFRWMVGPGWSFPANYYPPRTCGYLCAEFAVDADGAVYRHYPATGDRGQPVFGVERCLPGKGCKPVYDPFDPPERHDVPGEPPRRAILTMPPYPSIITGP